MKDRKSNFNLKPITLDKMKDIILKLKNSKSTGVDGIPAFIIKLSIPIILPAVTHVINLSISKSIFPSNWKHSKVTPLLKKGCSLTASNYRPVSQQIILSSILERAGFFYS